MLRLLWLVPMLPLAGFAILALGGRRLSRRAVSGGGDRLRGPVHRSSRSS